ncbi:MAG TPA: hypothetical protein VIH76_19170 [Candidatus Acidoferrales bacterium]
MAIEPHTSPQPPVEPGYETRDANPAAIVKFGVGLAIVLIAVAIGMRVVFGYFAETQNLGPAASPFENARTLPPQPRLQVMPEADIHDYWEREQEILKSYGWADKQNGIVRIPIDQAMRLTLERGLPSRPAKPAEQTGTMVPSEATGASHASAKPAGNGTE